MKHFRTSALLRIRVPLLAGALVFIASAFVPDTSARGEAASEMALAGPAMAPIQGDMGVALAAEGMTEAAPAMAADDSAVDALVDAAVRTLAPRVVRTSHTNALRTAFEAYYAHRAAHPEEVTKPYLYFVDFGLPNSAKRGWVFDMDARTVVEGPFTVAHGRGSGPRNGVPTKFSNRPGSYASSLGLYLAQETYTFSGKSGGRRYTSVGLRMKGESGAYNSAARRRGIVAHGAPYVTASQSGRSEGCPAMESARAQRLLPLIANGGVVFIYSPRAAEWLRSDPWVNAA